MNEPIIKLSSLSERAREIIRSAAFRPRQNLCFANAGKAVTKLDGLQYAEGWVSGDGGNTIFAHAWVVVDGQEIDLTLPILPLIFTRRTFTAKRYVKALKRGFYGFITPELVPGRSIYPPADWWPRNVLEVNGAYNPRPS